MKAKIIALAKKQGAQCTIGRNGDGDTFIEVALPESFIWENGYGSGLLYQEKYESESMAEFWQQAFDFINAPVIKG